MASHLKDGAFIAGLIPGKWRPALRSIRAVGVELGCGLRRAALVEVRYEKM